MMSDGSPSSRKRGIVRILIAVAALFALIYAAMVGSLLWREDLYVYPRASHVFEPPRKAADAGLVGFTDIALTTKDGQTIAGWWKPPQPGRALILYFHGNGDTLWNLRHRVATLSQDGRGLLIITYDGYPGSTGYPSEKGLYLDAEAAYAFVSDYAPERLVLYGHSLGSGVATWLASTHKVGGVILDAPYTSIPDVARIFFWYVPVGFMQNHFRSIDRIARIHAPLLILHGDKDDFIPARMGEALFKAAEEPKQFVKLPEAGHVTDLEEGGLPYVRKFLDQVEMRLKAVSGAPGRG